MYLYNAWYVAAWAHEIGRSLFPRVILEQPVVLYRTQAGEAVALEDYCVHRKLPLSMGRLKADAVECGYHGMTFDCTGKCIRVPGQDLIPTSAKVRSYPLAERWGLIWIWMGDPARADVSLIIDVPHYDDPDWGVNRGEVMHIRSNYQLLTDNLIDPAHTTFVHPTTLATQASEDIPVGTSVEGHVVTVSKWTLNSEPAAIYKKFGNFSGAVDRWQIYNLHLPSISIIDMGSAPAGSGAQQGNRDGAVQIFSYNCVTPETADSSYYHWFQVRSFAADDATVSDQMTKTFKTAFDEDIVVLEAVHEGLRKSTSRHIDIGIDAGNRRARKMLERMIAQDAEQSAST